MYPASPMTSRPCAGVVGPAVGLCVGTAVLGVGVVAGVAGVGAKDGEVVGAHEQGVDSVRTGQAAPPFCGASITNRIRTHEPVTHCGSTASCHADQDATTQDSVGV